MSKLVAVSPHLDDAVLSASDLIAHYTGATVVTVFAGQPVTGQPLTDWDRTSGFSTSQNAVSERRLEDRYALEQLHARQRLLDHRDRQYGAPSPRDAIFDDLAAIIEDSRPDVIAFPLGLHHPDHLTVTAIMLDLRDAATAAPIEWIAWADSPYRALPHVLDSRLANLRQQRDVLPWSSPIPQCINKPAALARYRSQIRALQNDDALDLSDASRTEQYWSIGPTRHYTDQV